MCLGSQQCFWGILLDLVTVLAGLVTVPCIQKWTMPASCTWYHVVDQLPHTEAVVCLQYNDLMRAPTGLPLPSSGDEGKPFHQVEPEQVFIMHVPASQLGSGPLAVSSAPVLAL